MVLANLLPVVALAGIAGGMADDVVEPPRASRVLAETLASADTIESVTANGRTITFAISRRGEALSVVATTRGRGVIASLAVVRMHEPVGETGNLRWLVRELAGATAITRLEVDHDGAIIITTSDRRRYLISSRFSGSNAAVEARWAAAWSAPAD